MICTYYLDVMSQWCMFADRAVAKLIAKYGDAIAFDYRIAPVKDGQPLGYTQSSLRWMYDRSESISGIRTNATWVENELTATISANAACLAAMKMGADSMAVRKAIQDAMHRDGRPLGRKNEVLAVVAAASGLDATRLADRSDDPAIHAELHANVLELRALGSDLRPTFTMQNEIGDRMILSGTWQYDVLETCIDSLLHDERAYADFESGNPAPF